MHHAVRRSNHARISLVSSLLVLVTVALATGGLGCKRMREKMEQKAAEQAIQAGTGGQVTINDGNNGGISVHDKNGNTVTVGENKVPADWPSNVPLYPNAKVMSAVSNHESGKASSVVTMQTTDAAPVVYTFFKAKLASFEQTSEVNANGMHMLVVEDKKTKQNISVVVSVSGAETTVQVATSKG